MTTTRSYKCNLCRDEIAPSGRKEGFGVHFGVCGTHAFKRVSECEHHICLQCAKCVHDNLRAAVPEPKS